MSYQLCSACSSALSLTGARPPCVVEVLPFCLAMIHYFSVFLVCPRTCCSKRRVETCSLSFSFPLRRHRLSVFEMEDWRHALPKDALYICALLALFTLLLLKVVAFTISEDEAPVKSFPWHRPSEAEFVPFSLYTGCRGPKCSIMVAALELPLTRIVPLLSQPVVDRSCPEQTAAPCRPCPP